jgi:Tol biopolymer transport system component
VTSNRARAKIVVLGLTVTLALSGLIAGAEQKAAQPVQRQVLLAFRRGGESNDLWVAARDGTRPRRISTATEQVVTPVGFSPTAGLLAWWSIVRESDGRSVYGLRVWPVKGGAPKTIFEDAQATYREGDAPEFTPDGKLIIFGRATGEFGADDEMRDWGLWQIRVDGTHPQRLTKGFGTGGGSRDPKLSPDGKTIAFDGYESEEAGRLCFASRAGGKVRHTQVWIHEFVWSPRGDSVIVTEASDEDPYTDRLAVYHLRNGTLTRLTDYHGGQASYGPTFSPDGRLLAFGLLADEGGWVRVLELRPGRTPKRVANIAASQQALNIFAWSPAGDRLFFTAYVSAANPSPEIWGMRPDGTDRHKVLDDVALAGIFWRQG